MRAVELVGSQIVYRDDYAPARDDRGLIEVQVRKAGICETDLQLMQGYMGFSGVLGHEFVGVAQTGRYAGQRVVGEINCACRRCSVCLAGRPRHCPGRTVIGILNHDGAFADQVLVPEENLHPVPDSLPDHHAVFTEPVAAACRIQEQVQLTDRDSIIILGDGRLGNLSAQVLSASGLNVTVVGKHRWKLDQLAARGSATLLLSDFQPDHQADCVIDCTGSPSGLGLALQAVRPLGTIVMKTTVASEQQLHFAPVVIDEVNIVGSRCGPFAPALELLTSGAVQVDSLISATYPLPQVVQAFEHAQRPDALKVLLDVDSPA